MRKSILITILLLSLSWVSCAYAQSLPDSLFGAWKLIRIEGGFSGQGYSNPNHDVILFSSGCKFRAYFKDSLKSSSNFHLRKSKSIYSSRDSVYRIRVEGGLSFSGSFSVSNKKLYIRDEMFDGFTHIYRRIYTKQQIDEYLKKAKY